MVRNGVIPLIAAVLTGCFYAPQQKLLANSKTHLLLNSPYYRVWDAVHKVVANNDYRIVTENPDDGILEAQAAGSFTLADADCGKLRGVGWKYSAEPDPAASAIYDIQVKPRGNEAATVDIQGTFTAPLHVPLHPVRGEQCVSRGTQEARLLGEIAKEVRTQDSHPEPAPAPVPARETVE